MLHLKVAKDYLRYNKFPQAIKEIKRALSFNPNSKNAHNMMGLTFLAMERFNKAEAHFHKSLKIDPTFSEVHNNLCVLYIEINKLGNAIEECQLALKEDTYPSPEYVHTNIGRALFKMKKYDGAKSSFIKALKFNSKFCYATHYLGRLHFEKKEYDLAYQSFSESIKSCPNDYKSRYYLGLALVKVGKKKRAMTNFKSIIAQSNNIEYIQKAKEAVSFLTKTYINDELN